MIVTSELRRTWAGHTVVTQLCDALDEADAVIAGLEMALQIGIRQARTDEARSIEQNWNGNPPIQYRARAQAFRDVIQMLKDIQTVRQETQ